jgi:hypothetical protein
VTQKRAVGGIRAWGENPGRRASSLTTVLPLGAFACADLKSLLGLSVGLGGRRRQPPVKARLPPTTAAPKSSSRTATRPDAIATTGSPFENAGPRNSRPREACFPPGPASTGGRIRASRNRPSEGNSDRASRTRSLTFPDRTPAWELSRDLRRESRVGTSDSRDRSRRTVKSPDTPPHLPPRTRGTGRTGSELQARPGSTAEGPGGGLRWVQNRKCARRHPRYGSAR